MTISWRKVFAAALFAVSLAGQSLAQEASAPSRIKVEVGVGTWITSGDTRWSHNASAASPLGNPTSRLAYTDHTANLVDLTAKISVGPRWFGRINLGFGNINGGRLTDDDFLTPDGGTPSSRTHSDIKNSGTYYINLEGGARLMSFAESRGYLDGLVGFQYWHEEHQAYGVRQISCSSAGATIDLDSSKVGVQPLCNSGASPVANSVLAITNKTSWYSIRTGVQAEYHLTPWLSVQGMAVFKPLSIFDNKDTHHLRRSDFQDPSFTMLGVGIGADADASLKFTITKWLALNAGYRVFWNRMIDGTWKNHLTDGSSQAYPLTQFQSIRHGAMFGLTASF